MRTRRCIRNDEGTILEKCHPEGWGLLKLNDMTADNPGLTKVCGAGTHCMEPWDNNLWDDGYVWPCAPVSLFFRPEVSEALESDAISIPRAMVDLSPLTWTKTGLVRRVCMCIQYCTQSAHVVYYRIRVRRR